MKQFLFRLFTLLLFVLSLGLFYLATTVAFPTLFINLALLVCALFTTVQACGNVDKLLGYGKHSKDNENNTGQK